MTSLTINGPARLVGVDINTDYIISSRRKRVTIDPGALRLHIFEDYDAEFGQSLKPDDIIVAGKNFGCGSAMEVAVTVVRAAGISCVLAPSFARAYYRNAINNGLLPVVCDTSSIQEDDTLSIVSEGNDIHVTNTSRDISIGAASLSSMMIEILKTGGLTEYLRKHGDFPSEI